MVLVGAVESVDAPGPGEVAMLPARDVVPVPPVVRVDHAPAGVVA